MPFGTNFRRTGTTGGAATATVQWAWNGAVGTATATVKARAPLASSLSLIYSTNSDLSSPAGTVSGTDGVDDMWTFAATGLTANTQYYYGFDGGHTLTGQFKTFPAGTASFTIAAASCAGHPGGGEYITGGSATSDSPAFSRILDRAPAAFIHLGDLHYRDISTNSPFAFRSAYHDVLANARQAELYRKVATAYIWDDHDYGANNSDGTSLSKPAAQDAYRRYVPHYTLPSASAIYQTFAIGRVRFFLLDVRSERTPNTSTDNASKTMLGATQKQWFKDQLLAATEPAIVVAMGSAWNGTLADNWGSFSTERQELAEFFEDNGLTSKLILLHGDIHGVLGDDGTNTQWDPGASTDGPMLCGFAALDGNATTYTGTYQYGPTLTTRQQYGTIAFADSGGTITATATAWASSGTASESQVFTFNRTFGGSAVGTQVAAGTGLAAAIAAASNGDTLLLRAGTHTIGSGLTGSPAANYAGISTSKYLTIKAYPGETPNVTWAADVRNNGLYFTGSAGTATVQGLTFTATSTVTNDANGCAAIELDGGSHLIIDGCTFIGNASWDDHQQLVYQRLGTDILVTGCTFTANGTDGFGFHQYPADGDPGCIVEDSTFTGFSVSGGVTTDSTITVRDCVFNSNNIAVQLRNDADNSVITGNSGTGNTTELQLNGCTGVTDSGNTWT